MCGLVRTDGFSGQGLRPNAGLVRLNSIGFDTEKLVDSKDADRTIIHEIGHVLGIGTSWKHSGYLRLNVDRPEFTGPSATTQFNRLSPRRAASARRRGVNGVPVEDNGVHWRATAYTVDGVDATYTVRRDLMLPGGNRYQNDRITDVTVGALEDLGYGVDYSQADQ